MTTIDNEFIFHNVGQGLFYSGEINNFNFVYDCGTLSRDKAKILKDSIDTYYDLVKKCKFENNKKIIDLLILSHFHEDHINGIDYLFEKFIVKEVIIPYYLPIERLLIAIESMETEQYNDKIISFILEPIEYLFNKDVKRVTLIVPKSKNDDIIYKDYKNDRSHYKADNDLGLVFKLKNADFAKYYGLSRYIDYINKGKLNVCEHDGSVELNNLWEFRFFCHDYGKSKLVKNLMRKFDGILNGINLKDALGDKAIRDAITEEYRKITTKIKKGKVADFNLTSLIMHHGPLQENFSKIEIISYFFLLKYLHKYTIISDFIFLPRKRKYKFPDYDEHWRSHGRYIDMSIHYIRSQIFPYCGQLFLSDANFKNPNFFKHFRKHLSQSLIFTALSQLPHHGSKRSWNCKLIKLMPCCFLWIPSYGKKNNNGHPSFEVINNIKSEGLRIIRCNEGNRIHIKFII